MAGAGTNAFDEILKATPPALVSFLANLPAVEGNFQISVDYDFLSIILLHFFNNFLYTIRKRFEMPTRVSFTC